MDDSMALLEESYMFGKFLRDVRQLQKDQVVAWKMAKKEERKSSKERAPSIGLSDDS